MEDHLYHFNLLLEGSGSRDKHADDFLKWLPALEQIGGGGGVIDRNGRGVVEESEPDFSHQYFWQDRTYVVMRDKRRKCGGYRVTIPSNHLRPVELGVFRRCCSGVGFGEGFVMALPVGDSSAGVLVGCWRR